MKKFYPNGCWPSQEKKIQQKKHFLDQWFLTRAPQNPEDPPILDWVP